MDPALEELVETGSPTDEVSVVVRLRDAAHVPPALRLIAQFGPIATARIQRLAVRQAWEDPAVISLKAPRWYATEYGPVLDPVDAENIEAADDDQRRPPNLEQTGRGSVIGVIDWGCDFAHPDFVNADKTSRLIALWDQRASGNDGNRYGYGRIQRNEQLTAALAKPDPYVAIGYHPGISDTGVGAHGTHVMSIAAGNGRGGGPIGLAPDASLIFVHLGTPGWERSGPLGDSANLLEAIDFIVKLAGKRPLVFNMSMGRHGGPHDGTQLVERALDWLMRHRVATAFVQSTGNYNLRRVHSCGRLRSGEEVVLPFQVNPGDDTPNELEVWYAGKDVFGLRLIAPDDPKVIEVPLGGKEAVNSKGRRTGTLYHRARDPNNGDNHINLFQYANAPPGVWKAVLRGIDVVDGRYHAWLERDPGCKTCQAQFPIDHSVRESTTGSICNGFLTISVGAYDGHNPARPLAPFSSSGPTRDGRVKPLVLAPGMRVLAARSHPKSGSAPLLTRMSGTSMAAPHVTGTLALMFEAGGALDIVRLRQALFDALAPSTARDPLDRDRIGYGFLDTAHAVRNARAAASSARYAPATGRQVARETDELEISEIETVSAAPEISPAETVAEHDAPQPEQEAAMSDMCCGDKCKNCEHCQNYPCETCQCCQPKHTGEAAPEPTILASTDPSWRSTAEPRRPQEFAGHEPADAPLYLHPVDAADELLEIGEHDPTRFVEQSLSRTGHVWPEHSDVRSLFDDLIGRTTPERHAAMQQHFSVIAEPGHTLSQPLQAGDLVIRRADGDFAHAAMVAHPLLYREHDATAQGLVLEGPWPGFYAHILEPGMSPHRGGARFARRVTAPDGQVLPDTLIVRPRTGGEATENDESGEGVFDMSGGSYVETKSPDPNMRWLQAALNRAINAGLSVDGIDGPMTRAAIRRYQSANNLTVDGIAGPQTRAALAAVYPPPGVHGGYTPPSSYTPPGSYTPPSYQPPPYTPPGGDYPPPPTYTPPGRDYPPPPPPTYTPPGGDYPPPPPPNYTPPGGDYPPPPPPSYTPPGGDYPPPPPPTYTPPGGDYPPPPPPGGDYPPPRPPTRTPPGGTYPPPPGYRPPGVRTPPRRPPGYKPPNASCNTPPPRPPGYKPTKPPAYKPPPPRYRPPPSYTPPGYSPPEAVPPGATCRTLDMFGYDSTTLTPAHRAGIADIAQRMTRGNATAVNLVGYSSPEGPAAYNLALGQRRADAVAAALREALDRNRAGASARIRFSVTSRGEENTVSNEAARNRRVEVCYVETALPVVPPVIPPQTRTRIRHSIDTPGGRAMLQKYEQAVRLMMAEPAGSPRSWLFQWYTHAVRDDRGKTDEINRIYGSSPSPNRTLALAMWNTCQAHHPGNNEQFFLPWHRMYVDFFERICQRVLNDDSFTLPYWNYSRAGSRALPAPFRRAGSSLFRADRNPGVNNGAPIDQNSPPGSLSAVPSLSRPTYNPQGVAPGFNDFLDGDLHGNVHVAIGNRRGMGSVPWAANDPIFWLHHCNIDRLWASWNRAGRRNPTDSTWLNTNFTFADENGRQTVATVRDFSTTSARGYTYDQFEPVPGAQPASEANMDGEAEADQDRRPIHVASAQRASGSTGGIALGAGPLTVHLAPHETTTFESQIEALGDTQRLYLVISNYKAEAQPGVLYHVYLDLPSGPGAPHREGHYVGTMNFFDAVPHSGHQNATMTGKNKSFDVTDVVRRLHGEGRTGSSPSVTIVPAGRPATEARPVIGDISLVGQ